IFILNLELAYCMPPLGLNLFISSFRFNRPVASLYRVVLPFAGILTFALILVSYIPWISDVAIRSDIAAIKAQAAQSGVPRGDAWMLECVQDDPNDPKPCTEEERKKFGVPNVAVHDTQNTATATTATDEECNPDFGECPPPGTKKTSPPDAGAAV